MAKEPHESISRPRNAAFARQTALYADIEREFHDAVESLGLPFAPRKTEADRAAVAEQVRQLAQRGILVENGGKSLHSGWISPSCIQCRKGLSTLTLGLSIQCPRNCYFCFNANQRDDEELRTSVLDAKSSLDAYRARGAHLEHIALTGGEPLVHKAETLEFFTYARELYPEAYLRLYTSGAYLDEAYLRLLQEVRLDEIRFSIKLEEAEESEAYQEEMLALIELAGSYIPNVMVEMPVAPDQVEAMKALLVQLDAAGVKGINLLEFCYPLNNAHEFAKRGYAIKNPPFPVYYDYEYAGGLPIDGSEEACLALLDFALDQGLRMGCHYCSLENKFTSQLYLQNAPYQESFPLYELSPEGYFLKAAKAFGDEAEAVKALADETGAFSYEVSADGESVTFPLSAMPLIVERCPDGEVGVSWGAVETLPFAEGFQSNGNGRPPMVLKELKLECTTPRVWCDGNDKTAAVAARGRQGGEQ